MSEIVVLALAAYVSIAGALFLFQRKLIYAPDPTRPVPENFGVPEMEPVALTTEDGLELVAWWREPADREAPVMVFLHGNAGHIGDRAPKVRPYLEAGWGVLLTSWRGFSGNPGRPSEKGLYADGRAALAFLRRHGVVPARVVLYGESLGGAVAIHLATEEDVGAVALEAPFSSIVDVAARRFRIFPTRFLVRDRFESIAKIPGINVPLLLVHGNRDEVIPVSLGRKLFEAASHPKQSRFIEGATHNDLYDHGAPQMVLSFVNSHFEK